MKNIFSWFIFLSCFLAAPERKGRVVSDETLSYTNLTAADSQVIQCNISNKHGYKFANAYLNVLGM